VHRDHYSLAATLGTEFGADVTLGLGEKPTLDMLFDPASVEGPTMVDQLREAGASDLADLFERFSPEDGRDDRSNRYPDTWLSGDEALSVGARTLDAIHTPGHTRGHFVFAEQAAGLLFAGDHVLPTITPSIGFEPAVVDQPLRDFMTSLARMRDLPDLRLLPAHGPVAPSTHARVDELLVHHEHRLDLALASLAGSSAKTSLEVAGDLPWTRHEHAYSTLDEFNAALAVMETKAHLELLVARGQASRTMTERGVVFSLSG
jgi:glyoxylase-like metal-dependent hydrolase (beta-lactamase superfamily II)